MEPWRLRRFALGCRCTSVSCELSLSDHTPITSGVESITIPPEG